MNIDTSILISIVVLFAFFMWLRFFSPPILIFNRTDPNGYHPHRYRSFFIGDIDMKLQMSSAVFTVRSAADIHIPNGQWRKVPIGGYFTPLGTFRIPFTNVVVPLFYGLSEKVFTTGHWARRRALKSYNKFVQDDAGQWCILVYNDYFFDITINRGEIFAHVEFYRTPWVICFTRNKLKTNKGV